MNNRYGRINFSGGVINYRSKREGGNAETAMQEIYLT